MTNNQGQRLDEFRIFLGLNKKLFLKEINYSSVTAYDAIVRGDKNVSKAILNELSEVFPQCNLNWIIGNRGNMLNSQSKDIYTTNKVNEPVTPYDTQHKNKAGSNLESENERLRQENELLKRTIYNMSIALSKDIEEVQGERSVDNFDLKIRINDIEMKIKEREKAERVNES